MVVIQHALFQIRVMDVYILKHSSGKTVQKSIINEVGRLCLDQNSVDVVKSKVGRIPFT